MAGALFAYLYHRLKFSVCFCMLLCVFIGVLYFCIFKFMFYVCMLRTMKRPTLLGPPCSPSKVVTNLLHIVYICFFMFICVLLCVFVFLFVLNVWYCFVV